MPKWLVPQALSIPFSLILKLGILSLFVVVKSSFAQFLYVFLNAMGQKGKEQNRSKEEEGEQSQGS